MRNMERKIGSWQFVFLFGRAAPWGRRGGGKPPPYHVPWRTVKFQLIKDRQAERKYHCRLWDKLFAIRL